MMLLINENSASYRLNNISMQMVLKSNALKSNALICSQVAPETDTDDHTVLHILIFTLKIKLYYVGLKGKCEPCKTIKKFFLIM